MTSEGGGAVAFPVMTLALGLSSTIARDFSLMIQSCGEVKTLPSDASLCHFTGMSAASFTIFWMRIKIELHSIVFCSLGAICGIIFGLEVVDEQLSSEEKKIIFVSVWFSFAFALFLLNRQHKRKTYDQIQNFGLWQASVLVLTGFAGGNFTALAGSGVDICSFSMLALLFRYEFVPNSRSIFP